jgi:hypothetical protein
MIGRQVNNELGMVWQPVCRVVPFWYLLLVLLTIRRLFSRFLEGRWERKRKEVFVFKLHEAQIGLITGPQAEESEGSLNERTKMRIAL